MEMVTHHMGDHFHFYNDLASSKPKEKRLMLAVFLIIVLTPLKYRGMINRLKL